MKTLVVGMAPTGDAAPLSGPSGKRLAALAGVDTLSRRFAVLNLLDRPVAGWPLFEAREAASRMREGLSGRRVILLGASVARAFGYEPAPLLKWRYDGRDEITYAVVPHTSGRNRWYNDPENVARAHDFMVREAAKRRRQEA